MRTGRIWLALAAIAAAAGAIAAFRGCDTGPQPAGPEAREMEAESTGPVLQARVAHREAAIAEGAAPGTAVSDRTSRGSTAPPRADSTLGNLRWLAAHQSPDGSWDPARAGAWCDGKPVTPASWSDAGLAQHNVGATGWALIAFLSAGYTTLGDHEFRDVVRKGAAWLRRDAQRPDGFLATSSHPTWLWDHTLATSALLTLYGMTESTVFLPPVQRALEALVRARDPRRGTWTYEERAGGVEETLTLWAALPLLQARVVHDDCVRRGKTPPWRAYEAELGGVLAWIDAHTDPTAGALSIGCTNEVPGVPGSSHTTLGALSLLVQVLACRDARVEGPLRRGLVALAAAAPTWDARTLDADPVFVWATAHALFGGGGRAWNRWEAEVLPSVVAAQHGEGERCSAKGSWDPAGQLGRATGRVGTTAILGLSLTLLYRYDRDIGCDWRARLPAPASDDGTLSDGAAIPERQEDATPDGLRR